MRSSVAVLLLACGLAGCEKISRIRECRAFAATVDQAMQAVEANAKANRPADYRAAARGYLALAKAARAVKFATAAGQASAEEYAVALESLAPAVQAYADALEGGERRAEAESRREIERLGRREHAAAARIDGYCRSP